MAAVTHMQQYLHDKSERLGLNEYGLHRLVMCFAWQQARHACRPAACRAGAEHQLSSWQGHPGHPAAAASARACFPPSPSAAAPSSQASAHQGFAKSQQQEAKEKSRNGNRFCNTERPDGSSSCLLCSLCNCQLNVLTTLQLNTCRRLSIGVAHTPAACGSQSAGSNKSHTLSTTAMQEWSDLLFLVSQVVQALLLLLLQLHALLLSHMMSLQGPFSPCCPYLHLPHLPHLAPQHHTGYQKLALLGTACGFTS